MLLKNDTRDFQNSPLLKWLACFYVEISGNFETDFLEDENHFQKTGVLIFS